MIQRKQSLYLLGLTITAVLITLLNMKISSGTAVVEGFNTEFRIGIFQSEFSTDALPEALNHEKKKVQDVVRNSSLIYTMLASALIAFICIFLFKKTDLQLRLVALNFVFILAACFYAYYSHYKVVEAFKPVNNTSFSPALLILALLPLFNYLAMKGIKKDIELLASVDRLR